MSHTRYIGGIALLSAMTGVIAVPGPAQAQAYPFKPVRVVVAMGAGGAADLLTRTITPALSERLGQQCVVDDRPGANGVLGQDIVAKANADGYTLLVQSIAMAINASLYKLPHDTLRDFAPITRLATTGLILVVNPSVPARNVKELIALARAQPGALNYSSFGNGSIAQIAGETFKIMTGTKIAHVAYKTSPAAVTDTIAGQVQMVFAGIPYSMGHVNAGRLRALAVSMRERSPLAPEVSTMIEAGVKDFEVVSWFGVWAPAKTPKPVIDRLHQEIMHALNTPEVRKSLAARDFRPVGSVPHKFAAFVRAEVAKYARLVKEAGIKVDG
ncbi:MAG: tripartite tricarboxylate transporter substrate binding protein [Betaproteobacteria bacterium]|nr:tripartite tricarboxylate transporter substrate binding protein [Betaproteobacteria bacterium]